MTWLERLLQYNMLYQLIFVICPLYLMLNVFFLFPGITFVAILRILTGLVLCEINGQMPTEEVTFLLGVTFKRLSEFIPWFVSRLFCLLYITNGS